MIRQTLAIGGGGVVVSSYAVVEAAFLLQGIGPDTPVSGITVASLLTALVAGAGLLAAFARYWMKIGATLNAWRTALDEAAKVQADLASVRAQQDAVARWQFAVEPIIMEAQVRFGIQRRTLLTDNPPHLGEEEEDGAA